MPSKSMSEPMICNSIFESQCLFIFSEKGTGRCSFHEFAIFHRIQAHKRQMRIKISDLAISHIRFTVTRRLLNGN